MPENQPEEFTPEEEPQPPLWEVRARAVQEERAATENELWEIFKDSEDDVPILNVLALIADIVLEENKPTPVQAERLGKARDLKNRLAAKKAEIKRSDRATIAKMRRSG